MFRKSLQQADPAVADLIALEAVRQSDQIELIASENIVPLSVMQAQGTLLTNKYAEGYPGRRYYGGCEHVDGIEQLAIDRAKQLFDAEFVNVQLHSGAQANGAVKLALLQPGDAILGMSLDAGGHLTHGARPALSGKWFKAIQYGVREDNALIDYDQVARLAEVEKPKLIIAGASAYSRHIDFEKFRSIADRVGAYLLVDMAHIAQQLAEQNGAELTVVSVIPEIIKLPNLPEDYGDGAAEYVNGTMQKFLDDAGVKAQLAIKQGSVYREILKLAFAEGFDLIAMLSPKGDFPDYPLGPNVARVTRHANCSVLVVRG